MAKVLIVEDEIAISNMYKFKLESQGYEVICAYNGIEGLNLAESELPDLIMLDLRMPYMGGDEMLRILRSKDWGGNIRVIILTNISKSETPSSLRFLNVDRFIVKAHHTPAYVLEVVKDIIN